MKYISYPVVCILFLFTSCKQSGASSEAKSCQLSGRYMNMTILDKCSRKMPVDIPHFAHELIFKGTDTVLISNGFEKFNLPYASVENECMYKIAGATLFGDMYFTVTSDSTLQLLDSAWTKVDAPSEFARIHQEAKEDWAFENLLNDCVIAGTYEMVSEGKNTRPVTFFPNGQVTGLKNFLAYELCYAGDCLGETDPPSNTIDFTDDRGMKHTFVYKMPSGNKSDVQFYSVGEPIPDEKGGRSIGSLAFELKS